MIGLGIAFLVLLALAGTASAKSGLVHPVPPPGPAPDVPTVVPGPPDPKLPTNTTKGKSGTTWITQVVEPSLVVSGESIMFGVMPGAPTLIDVFLPDGQKGSHPTFRVIRFSVNLSTGPGAKKFFVDAVPGVDQSLVDLAMSDFDVVRESTPGPIDTLPLEWQQKIAEMLEALTVDPITGMVSGPVTSEIINRATTLCSDLERAGYPAAAATLRAFAKAAASLVKTPVDPIKIPGLTQEMIDRVARAMSMEGDPAKLRDIMNALKQLPPSGPRDMAIAAINAKIIQIEAGQASELAKKQIECVTRGGKWDPVKQCVVPTTPATPPPPPGPPPPAPPGPPPVTPPAPPAPPAPPTGLRTYKPGPTEYGSTIAKKFTGDGNRWRELLPVNAGIARADAKYGIAWNPGATLNIPASWPNLPGAVTPPPSVLVPPPPAPPAPSNVYVISAKDGIGPKGPSGLAAAKTGNGNRWRELIPVNPKKKLNAQGTNFATWYPGEVITLPSQWLTGAAAPSSPAVPAPPAPIMPTDTPAVPQAMPTPKSALEMAAEAMVKNIRAVQAARGAKGAKGAEDQSLVRKFQTLAGGGTPDGLAGMGTMIAAARAGQSSLPAVPYWPKAATSVQILAQKVLEYRSALRALAAEARTAGLDSRAIALDQSASNEVAASDQRGPLSV